jgi:hypothetical protein
MKARSSFFLAPVVFSACIHAEPPRAPKLEVDEVELFHRARFEELSKTGDDALTRVVTKMRPRTMSPAEDRLDSHARAAYRHGDGRAAETAMRGLPDASRTKKILAALLAEADLSSPLFETKNTQKELLLQLDPQALRAGYLVFDAMVKDRKLRFLFDTGSTENVLSENAAAALGLPTRAVQFSAAREDGALIVRFAATGIPRVQAGPWSIENIPAIVTDLESADEGFARIDGFLSPQLLLKDGCFEINKQENVLRLGFDRATCSRFISKGYERAPLFAWDGEVYVSGTIGASPAVGLRLETGSPVTYLRADATRYVPKGAIEKAPNEREGEIAHSMTHSVDLEVAGRKARVSAVDLEPRRRTDGYDDVGTVGADLLFSGRNLVVSFVTMELALSPDPESFAACCK